MRKRPTKIEPHVFKPSETGNKFLIPIIVGMVSLIIINGVKIKPTNKIEGIYVIHKNKDGKVPDIEAVIEYLNKYDGKPAKNGKTAHNLIYKAFKTINVDITLWYNDNEPIVSKPISRGDIVFAVVKGKTQTVLYLGNGKYFHLNEKGVFRISTVKLKLLYFIRII